MKFAVIGLGFIANRHIAAIERTGNKVIWTCDPDESKRKDYPFVKNWRDLLEVKEIDAVSICTPNDLHYEIAKSFAEKGKKVLCEKPLTISSEDKLPDNVFTVLQLRHHPDLNKIKIGKSLHLFVQVKRDDSYWYSWKGDEKRSGGILFNLGIHYFDILIHLLGNDYEVLKSRHNACSASGIIKFKDTIATYKIQISKTDKGQARYIESGGSRTNFSDKDNLSYEDLHVKVYEDFIINKGVKPEEANKSIKLVEKLYGR